MSRFQFLFLSFWFVLSCQPDRTEYKAAANNPDFLHRAIKAVTDRMVHDIFSPPVASRVYAYTCIAAYEAMVPSDSSFASLSGQLHGLESVPKPDAGKEYCYPLASVQAALQVGRAMIFSESELDVVYNQIMNDFRNTGMPREVFDRSVEYGKAVATHILLWASKDNYHQTRSFPKYTILDDPGTWKPTPPAYMDAVEPHWNVIRPFTLDSADQFKPAPPTLFSTDKKSKFYEEALQVYETGKNLTAEQRNIAAFWDCNPFVMNVHGHVMFATKKISPGGHWINITGVVCKQTNADFITSAEAYACVAIALADGFISCWDEKYRSKLIRPETYINQYIDENWMPLLQTPPFPEHTSGHSVISSSAAVMLTNLFGDRFEFVDSTEVEFGLGVRKFTSFLGASEEAAISRLYGGIHYKPAIEQGVIQGRRVGDWVVEHIKTRKNILAPTPAAN